MKINKLKVDEELFNQFPDDLYLSANIGENTRYYLDHAVYRGEIRGETVLFVLYRNPAEIILDEQKRNI